MAADRRAVGDRLRLGPRAERVAEGEHVRVRPDVPDRPAPTMRTSTCSVAIDFPPLLRSAAGFRLRRRRAVGWPLAQNRAAGPQVAEYGRAGDQDHARDEHEDATGLQGDHSGRDAYLVAEHHHAE